MADLILRIRVHIAAPSLRTRLSSVANAIVDSGTTMRPVPSPCMNPDSMINISSIPSDTPDLMYNDYARSDARRVGPECVLMCSYCCLSFLYSYYLFYYF